MLERHEEPARLQLSRMGKISIIFACICFRFLHGKYRAATISFNIHCYIFSRSIDFTKQGGRIVSW